LTIISDDSLLPPQSAYVPVEGAECGFTLKPSASTSSTPAEGDRVLAAEVPFDRTLPDLGA
ncbi:hypothetical protein QUB76_39005, partial [Microcoleus sp. D2B6]